MSSLRGVSWWALKNDPSPGNMNQWDTAREERLTIDVEFVQFETNSFAEGIRWEKTRYQLDGEIATTSRAEKPSKFSNIQLSCLAITFVKNILIIEAKRSRRACMAQILGLGLSDGTQFEGAVMVHDQGERWHAYLRSGTKLPWSTILSLIEEGSFRLRKGQDARSPRFVDDRFIFESITETLDDTIGILVRKSFTAFVVWGWHLKGMKAPSLA